MKIELLSTQTDADGKVNVIVHKTFQEFHSRTALQYSAKKLK